MQNSRVGSNAVAFTRSRRAASARRAAVMSAAAMSLSLLGSHAFGQATQITETFDPNLNQTDGAGTWNTTLMNWYNGTSDVTFGNTGAYTAAFGFNSGTAGVATLTVNVTTGSILLNSLTSGAYTIGSGLTNGTATGTITFDGTFGTPTITNNDTAAATNFNTNLKGVSGLTFAGAGVTNLDNYNTTTRIGDGLFGGITIAGGGGINFGSPTALGSDGANVITFNTAATVQTGSDSNLGANPVIIGGLAGVSGSIFKFGYGNGEGGVSSLAGTTNTYSGVLNASGNGYTDFVGDGIQVFNGGASSVTANTTSPVLLNIATGGRKQQGTDLLDNVTVVADHTNQPASRIIAFGSVGLGGGTLQINGVANTAGVNINEDYLLSVLPGASSIVLVNQGAQMGSTSNNTVELDTGYQTSTEIPYTAYNGATINYQEPFGGQSFSTADKGNGWVANANFVNAGNANVNGIYAGGAYIVVNPNPVGTSQTASPYSFATGTNTAGGGNSTETLVQALTTYDTTSVASSTATQNVDQDPGATTLGGAAVANVVRINGATSTDIAEAGNSLTLTAGGLLVTQLSPGGSIRGGTITAANASFNNTNHAATTNNYSATGGELLVHQYGTGVFTIGSNVVDATPPAADSGATEGAIAASGYGTVTFSAATAVAPGMQVTFAGGATAIVVGVVADTAANVTGQSVTEAYVYNNSATAVAAGQTAITAFTSHTALVKSGTSDLQLSGTNTYSGPTYLDQGVMRLASPGALSPNSNLSLVGGVLGLGDADTTAGTTGPTTFTESIGTGAGAVQFLGSGGFASYNASGVSVNLGGASAAVTWGANLTGGGTGFYNGFVTDGGQLLLGAATGTGTVTFANPIALNDGDRTINVTHAIANGSIIADANISGAITGVGGLNLDGNGTLILSNNANTLNGMTQVVNGTLVVTGTGATNFSTSYVKVGNTGGTGTTPVLTGTGQIADTVEVLGNSGGAGSAGTLTQYPSTSGASTLTLKSLTLDAGSTVAVTSLIAMNAAGTSGSGAFAGTNLSVPNAGVNITVAGSTTPGTYDLFTFSNLNTSVALANFNVPAGDSLAYNGASEIDLTIGSPVPEPASASLILIGVGGLVARRRKRGVAVVA